MIKGLDHIAIAVRNLEEWLELFDRLFGLPASRRDTPPGGPAKVAFMFVGNASIEFMQPAEPASPLTPHLEKKGEGVHHICLEVDDIEREIQTLDSKGFPIASRETRPGGTMKLAFIHPRSTKGLLLQIGQKILPEQKPGGGGATTIDHVGVAVRSVDEWLGLFSRLFGLQPSVRDTLPGQGVNIAFVPFGQASMELMEPIGSAGPVNRFLESKGEAVHHVCFGVADVERELKALEGKGVQLVDRQPTVTRDRKLAFLHPRSTKGLLLQVAQKL